MLNYSNPLELLIATILSAQCTDERVNRITNTLFKKYSQVEDYARADPSTLMDEIRSAGFFRHKAQNIISCCQMLVERNEGKVPRSMKNLTALPGVGRKTANVILGNAFGIPGVVVDTHVGRVAGRIGLTANRDAEKIEFDLRAIVPQDEWTRFSHLLIFHGRRICAARKPRCNECPISKYCDYVTTHQTVITTTA